MLDKGFWKLPHTFYKKTTALNNSEFRLLIFLHSCHNSLGNKCFFITDKQITEYINLSRETIRQGRKHLKKLGFIDYISGKYEKKATTYYIKSAQNLGTVCTKSSPKSAQFLCNNNKELNKKEINKEYNLSLLQQTRKTYAKQQGW